VSDGARTRDRLDHNTAPAKAIRETARAYALPAGPSGWLSQRTVLMFGSPRTRRSFRASRFTCDRPLVRRAPAKLQGFGRRRILARNTRPISCVKPRERMARWCMGDLKSALIAQSPVRAGSKDAPTGMVGAADRESRP
jgi:hypothetical protein